jgi:hypothetical protein
MKNSNIPHPYLLSTTTMARKGAARRKLSGLPPSVSLDEYIASQKRTN